VNAISALNLVKEYPRGIRAGRVRAVAGINLEVPENEIFGLLGPNGSGKTTTLKMILGLVTPTAGECRVYEHSAGAAKARERIGYLPEGPRFAGCWRGREWLRLFGRLSGLSGAPLTGAVDRVVALSGLATAVDRRVSGYSRGMLQRLALARALIHDPDLIILDEPVAGLDPLAVRQLGSVLERLKAEGKTIVICSHLLSQAEAICDRFAFLDSGRVISSASRAEIASRSGRRRFEVSGLADTMIGPLGEFLAARGAQLAGEIEPASRLADLFLEACGTDESSRGK
jgi:ABC-2 type transport system ATP-binding protein